MKLIAQIKLMPSKEQAILLKKTLEQANALCNAILLHFLRFNCPNGGFRNIHRL
jgi:hypothetical protein